jgi:hypothetical protein
MSDEGQQTAVLRGKKLRRQQNQSDSSYGSGYYREASETIYLFADQTFRYEEQSFFSVSSRGLSLAPLERKRGAEGTWRVETIRGALYLVLWVDGTGCIRWRTRNGGVGVHYFDDVRWERYTM